MTHRLLQVVLVLLLVLPSAILSGVTASVTRADPVDRPGGDTQNPVVVVLDTSGSMNEADASGTPRIVGARSAVLSLVDALPPRSQFALIAYPGGGEVIDGCSTGKIEIPLGELDQATTAAAVRRLSPDGQTPTGPALLHAAEIIKRSPTQQGTIVLVSDGESNCGNTDVCVIAQQLSGQGVEIRVNTVGFQINPNGAKELNCIAKNTGGRYVPAEDKDQLENAVQEMSGARLTLEASVPNPLPVVSGTGNEGPKAVLTVSNRGRKDAHDVRLSLDFQDSGRKYGALLVPRPVRFLGNLAPGQTRRVEIVVRPDADQLNADFTWIAVATAADAAARRVDGTTRTAEPKLDGLLSGVRHIAVLGDSYSSGEGAGDYDSGTRCDRSAHAYGRVLVTGADPAADTTLIACSGAVTAHFYVNQENFGEPQLKALRRAALSDKSPDAVLLSIGGNDVDFAGTVKECFLRSCAADGAQQFRTEAANRVAAIGDSLRRVYRDVNRAVNDPRALARRDGNHAPIIVVPYPRIVPLGRATSVADCFANVDTDEINFFNEFTTMLNTQVSTAAAALAAERVPIYVATDVISAFQPDHTICDADRYAVTSTEWTDVVRKQILGDRELLHPNQAGNAAMARAISTFAAGQTMMVDPAPVTWSSIDAKKPVLPLSLAGLGQAGGDTPVDAAGFDPGSTIVFRLNSTPRILGSTTSADDGTVRLRVTLPTDIRPGRHHLHVLGMAPDGQMRDVVLPIRVVPPQTMSALLALAAGVLALASGGLGFWWNRRRNRVTATRS